MRVDVEPVRHVRLEVGNLPWESAENHAHEDDGDRPHVGQSGIILVLLQDLWGEVWIRSDDARGGDLMLAGVVEHCGRSKVDQFDNVVARHDTVVQFQIPMGQTHLVQVVDSVDNLPKDAVDFRAGHLSRHDNGEEIVRGILHDLTGSAQSRQGDIPRKSARDH